MTFQGVRKVWCPTCSRAVEGVAQFCDECGDAVQRLPPPSVRAALAPASLPRRPHGVVHLGALALLLLAAGCVGWLRWTASPAVTPDALHAAMARAIAQGPAAPGQDPICVANGLAYDREPVNVQLGNSATLAWMNMLVEAGLYVGPESGNSGGFLSQPISIYRPLPELAQWGGARRLCVARAMRLDVVTNLGPVEDVRLNGKRYVGVLADVRWTLDQPAPWLARQGVGEALARELPSWRNARWRTTGSQGWTLTQRKNFVLVDTHWMPGDAVERDRAGAPPRSAAVPL